MNTEIKEILGYIDQFVYVDQTYDDIKLSKIDSKLLLDYITNLQRENQELKEYSNQLESNYDLMLENNDNKLLMDYKSRIEKLQQELEKRNAYIKYLEEYNPKYYKGEKFYGRSDE